MQRFRNLGDCAPARGGYLTIGNFDGVHRGHQLILSRLRALADEQEVPAVVLTFEPHPVTLLRPDRAPPRLTTPDQKCRLLGEAGVDFVLEYATDWPLLRRSPQQFFQDFVVDGLDARGLVEGPNFSFGQGRSGTIETLQELCAASGRTLEILSPQTDSEQVVSSSAIRMALLAGDVGTAGGFLGRPYSIQGIVKGGAQRGRTLGFPTANLEQVATLIPNDGVYAADALTPAGTFRAAVNIGPNPTFGEDHRKIEAHLLGFSGDLYGASMELQFLSRLRDPRRFNSREELQLQIEEDVAMACRWGV